MSDPSDDEDETWEDEQEPEQERRQEVGEGQELLCAVEGVGRSHLAVHRFLEDQRREDGQRVQRAHEAPSAPVPNPKMSSVVSPRPRRLRISCSA